jgi:signal transduction histidine kinase/CheY-like chemotaxis protein
MASKAERPSRDRQPGSEQLERVLAELREANERLVISGVRLQELAEEAEQARRDAERSRAQAEAASHAKDEFLAALSHELRTPLNAILGWIHMLRQGTLTADAAQRALDIIERNAKSQMQVIADLLQVSEIITGKLRLDAHPIDLAPLVVTGLDTLRPAARAKEITIESDIQPVVPILGDPLRLQQILWNLLSNAIKFTPQGGRVQVTLRQAGSVVQISVTDSGVGIDPQFLPYVFDRFRQEHSSFARPFGGLGLGLAIVRQLVELHGGTVKAESDGKERGSTFSVSFPILTETGQSESVDQRSLVHSLRGLHLLVVEDDPDSRDLLTAMLEASGAHVRAAASAREALALIKSHRPDVIVADIGLPDEDGYAFMRRVRASQDSQATTVPAIALTAYARPEDRQRALAAGYQIHMAKPFEPQDLTTTVASLSRRSRRASTSDIFPERGSSAS